MNKYNPKIHARKSIRLKGYDYLQAGLYFLTICCHNRAFLFVKIVGAHPCGCPEDRSITNLENNNDFEIGKMILNDAGKMIVNEWLALKKRFANIELHEYVVMPNHFHAILEIVGATLVAQNDENDEKNEIGQPQGIAPWMLIKIRRLEI